jgi:hypothetical protein
MDRNVVVLEGETDLEEGTIILTDVLFVVGITVGNYFLSVCDY